MSDVWKLSWRWPFLDVRLSTALERVDPPERASMGIPSTSRRVLKRSDRPAPYQMIDRARGADIPYLALFNELVERGRQVWRDEGQPCRVLARLRANSYAARAPSTSSSETSSQSPKSKLALDTMPRRQDMTRTHEGGPSRFDDTRDNCRISGGAILPALSLYAVACSHRTVQAAGGRADTQRMERAGAG